MIPNITSGSNFRRLLAYCEDKPVQWIERDNGVDEWAGSERLGAVNFADGSGWQSTADELSASLHAWSGRSKRIEKPVFHASLSFSPGDIVDNVRAMEIAGEFLREMGYGEVPAVIYRHYDTAHAHLHLVASRVGEKGTKIDAFNEAKWAIGICRRLEEKYGLMPVSSVKKSADISIKALRSVDLKPGKPFKAAVLQNLQYYLNHEGVDGVAALQSCLRRHNIDMVTTDSKGNAFLKDGVIFYRLDKGSHRSMLRGSDLGKGFGSTLTGRMARNRDLRSRTGGVWQRPAVWDRPDRAARARYGPLLSAAYEELLQGAVYTPEDIRRSLAVRGINGEPFISARGELAGIAILDGDKRYRTADFFWEGRSLSSGVLRQNFVPRLSASAVRQHIVGLFSRYRVGVERDRLSMAEMHVVLNRNGIRLRAEEGQHYFSFERSGQPYRASVEKLFSGYAEFLKEIGGDMAGTVEKKQRKVLAADDVRCPMLDLRGRSLYHALVGGNEEAIGRMAGQPSKLFLTDHELVYLEQSLMSWKKYRLLHERLGQAESYLQSREQGQTGDFRVHLRALHERGVGVDWKGDGHLPGFRKAGLFLLEEPKTRLSAYDGPVFFSHVKLAGLFDRLPLEERQALMKILPGEAHVEYNERPTADQKRVEDWQTTVDQGMPSFDSVFANMLTAGGGATMVNGGADRPGEEEHMVRRRRRRRK